MPNRQVLAYQRTVLKSAEVKGSLPTSGMARSCRPIDSERYRVRCIINSSMNISIEPFTSDRIGHLQAFNRRMLAGGLKPEMAFPENPEMEFPVKGAPIWQERFLAVEGEAAHGGYYFTHERYALDGEVCWIANYRHPISEVVIDKKYKGLSSKLLHDAYRRQPLLYSVGFGGAGSPNLRRLKAEGWKDVVIPFCFRIVRPVVFLSNLAYLRKTFLRRLACEAAARTGLGWLAINAAQAIRAHRWSRRADYSAKLAPEFGPWADELWTVNRRLYRYAAVRDCATLNLRYPAENARFQRLVIADAKGVGGWAVLLDKRMKGNPYFGDMHVGTIVDFLAAPGLEAAVVSAAAAQLEATGVDILVSNQSSTAWLHAFRKAGFFFGPSNYYLAFSPELARRLEPLSGNMPKFHVNRGDGAGTSRL